MITTSDKIILLQKADLVDWKKVLIMMKVARVAWAGAVEKVEQPKMASNCSK